MFSGFKDLSKRESAGRASPEAGGLRIAQGRPGDDERFMSLALTLAAKGKFTAHPNPCVGCVIVNQGRVVGEGWHRAAGEDHAETIALQQAGSAARGATLYVTLEPCCHHGRTPPCSDSIIQAGVSRVVFAVEDPNPLVNRGGLSVLQEAGLQVSTGVCKSAATRINRGFFRRMRLGVPWVTLKIAVSLDGKTSMASGESQWITSDAARQDAHRLRAASSAILTGVGTVLRDDPKMTARIDSVERQPLRVILDSHLSTPPGARILQPPGDVLLVTTAESGSDAAFPGGDNVEVLVSRVRGGRIDLPELMKLLGQRQVNDLMVEAGPRLSGTMMQQGLVDELVVYMAPDLLGSEARGMFELTGMTLVSDRVPLELMDVRVIGRDLRLTLHPRHGAPVGGPLTTP